MKYIEGGGKNQRVPKYTNQKTKIQGAAGVLSFDFAFILQNDFLRYILTIFLGLFGIGIILAGYSIQS